MPGELDTWKGYYQAGSEEKPGILLETEMNRRYLFE